MGLRFGPRGAVFKARGFGARVRTPAFRLNIGRLASGVQWYHRRITNATEQARRRSLIRQAAYCKSVARRMLRPARAGEDVSQSDVPRLHSGNYFKMSVHWGYDTLGKFSVAGPIQITRRNVPRALERGGTSVWVRNHHGRRMRGRQRVRAKPFMLRAQQLTLRHFPGQFRGSFRR